MKRVSGLWPQVASFENLLAAFHKARRGKRKVPGVARFALGLEAELVALSRELDSGSYRPGDYRLFLVYERKPRQIAAAPFRDRVVHHALMNVLEPVLERTFIHDSYACRRGKGTHAAVNRCQAWFRRYAYALKMDVSRYFPSIDREILKEKLAQRVKDRRVLDLCAIIIDLGPLVEQPPVWFSGDDLLTPLERPRGIPIGNLTSQFFANLFLDDLDHYLKEQIGVRAYLRYVDDLVVLDDDKSRLAEIREMVRERLASDRLLLHPHKAHIVQTRRGIDWLGYQVFPGFRRLRSDNGRRFGSRLRRLARLYGAGRLDWADFDASVQSWIGHARQADTEGLRRVLLGSTVFTRGAGQPNPAGAPRRLVQQ